jgi:tRNA dimethylallyltransferase
MAYILKKSLKKIICVFGPTASGKSDYALKLAHEKKGQIINADSMQVYADLPILTARPSSFEQEGIKHHLYGFLTPCENFSVHLWLQKAAEKIKEVETPILVGGTGFYFKCLIEGLSDLPQIDEDIRLKVRQMPLNEVLDRVKDAVFKDPQRARRALEVLLQTGKPLSYWQSLEKKKYIDGDFQLIFINPPRPVLYDRCDKRFDKMLKAGALNQVKDFYDKKYPETCFLYNALGVSELIRFLKGELSFEDAVLSAKRETRRYAKRQVTFFKNQFTGYESLENVFQKEG